MCPSLLVVPRDLPFTGTYLRRICTSSQTSPIYGLRTLMKYTPGPSPLGLAVATDPAGAIKLWTMDCSTLGRLHRLQVIPLQ